MFILFGVYVTLYFAVSFFIFVSFCAFCGEIFFVLIFPQQIR